MLRRLIVGSLAIGLVGCESPSFEFRDFGSLEPSETIEVLTTEQQQHADRLRPVTEFDKCRDRVIEELEDGYRRDYIVKLNRECLQFLKSSQAQEGGY